MSKRRTLKDGTLFCGIDVSAKSLTVAVQQENQSIEQRCFPNNTVGHKASSDLTSGRKRRPPNAIAKSFRNFVICVLFAAFAKSAKLDPIGLPRYSRRMASEALGEESDDDSVLLLVGRWFSSCW